MWNLFKAAVFNCQGTPDGLAKTMDGPHPMMGGVGSLDTMSMQSALLHQFYTLFFV